MQHWLPVSFLPRSCEKTNTESFIIVQSHFHTLNIQMSMHRSIQHVICLNETFNHHQPVSRLSGWLSEWVRGVRVSWTANQNCQWIHLSYQSVSHTKNRNIENNQHTLTNWCILQSHWKMNDIKWNNSLSIDQSPNIPLNTQNITQTLMTTNQSNS